MGDPKEWARNGSFMKKPMSGWLHEDDALSHGDGVYYPVKVPPSPYERLAYVYTRRHSCRFAFWLIRGECGSRCLTRVDVAVFRCGQWPRG